MNANQAIRGSRLEPRPPQTFAAEPDRDRLSPVALKAFVALAQNWDLSNQQAAMLLGVSGSSWDRIKKGSRPSLNQDQLTRVSALVGAYKGLHLLFADQMADRWPGLPNRGPLFDGRSPIESMIAGGIPMMLDVRRYIDAARGGL